MESLQIIEAPFAMANLFPKHTGLPFVVWISVRGEAAGSPKVYADVIEGEAAEARELLQKWIELNRATLLSYWEGEIDTQDALEALTKVE